MIDTKVTTLAASYTDPDGDVWLRMTRDLLSLNGNRNPAAWRTFGEVVEMVGELREVKP